ncbi:GNAT family N-acetyltransferase [Patescibacteria group bacterium]|nr:GNAT family N-acetyltransferase [Patescibacteria group bacterium]
MKQIPNVQVVPFWTGTSVTDASQRICDWLAEEATKGNTLPRSFEEVHHIVASGCVVGAFLQKPRRLLIGSCFRISESNHTEIGGLVVHPDFRELGIGRVLIEVATKGAHEAKLIFALVGPHNAQHLFLSLGYQPVDPQMLYNVGVSQARLQSGKLPMIYGAEL